MELSPLARRAALTLDGLCALIAHHAAKNRALVAIVNILWNRLRRLPARLERLLARWKAGRLHPSAPRPAKPRTPTAARPRLPTSQAWLIRLIQPTAQFSGQIEILVNDPEIRALLADAPQAGRMLRPLCRMLGIALPDHLRLPKKPASPRRSRVKPRVPRPEGHRSSSPPRLRLRVPGLRNSTA